MTLRRRIPRTEERLLPIARRSEDPLLREHWERYRFVAPAVEGRILDVGCGTGYGALEIARQERVREVVACDRSPEALALASRYYPHPRVRHVAADLEKPGWEADLGRFDGVIALEILEHLRAEVAFWDGLERLLGGIGVLWLSTPLGRGRGRPAGDPFHVHQLRKEEIEDTFRLRGWDAHYYGQAGTWIETWTPGRRYYTILARARPPRRREDG